MMVPPPTRQETSWGAFGLWALVGVLFVVGPLSFLIVGLFVGWGGALVLVVVLARNPATHRGSPGLISGLGIPPLYVALLNRQGPGNVCHFSRVGGGCTQEMSPWPWLGAGLGLVLVGVLVFAVANHRARQRDAAYAQWYAAWTVPRPPWSDGPGLS